MKIHWFVFLLVLPALFFSCKPQQQLAEYISTGADSTMNKEVKAPELIIQKGDQLSIQIYSLSTKPDISDAIYNLPSGGGAAAAGEGAAGPGYLVDNSGNIVHHRLGVFHAEGLTRQALADEIKKRLTQPVELLKDPTVVVNITNFKVTLLGQVGAQGAVKVPGDRITLIEAIGLAGGITDYGKKTTVRVIREYNGQREIGSVDLSSKEIFKSPYYYLAQNDVVIVDETNKKYKDQEQLKTMQKISFAFTLVTVAATITNLFIRN